MRRGDAGLVVSPTDLTKFLACEHLTALDVEVAFGRRPKPAPVTDELLDLLFQKGNEHEQRYLATLRANRDVVEIKTEGSSASRASATRTAMMSGADVIYQAAFLHNGRVGYADFLLRADRPSSLGAWAYDVADTKLARRLKVPAILQMAEYGEHLRREQGEPPQTLTVVAGDQEQHVMRFASVEAYSRRLTARFDAFIAAPPVTVAEPVEHCDQCGWIATCTRGWRAADHLSFVAFLSQRQRTELEAAEVTTMAALGAAAPDELPSAMSGVSRERLVGQARLQLKERADRQPRYELLEPGEKLGLLRLPAPNDHDLYLDFEADRYVEPDGREFLAGVGENSGAFTAIWAHSSDDERLMTETLIDRILVVWQANPGMHVYHYAPYEQAALTRLVQRHTTREAELDILLRAGVFVDLYAVVRQSMQISKESYSIKKLEAFYWGAERRLNSEVAEALSSTLAYEQWLVDGDQHHLDAIEAYNKDDVDSTRDLHRWLEERRTELCERHATDFPRPTPPEVDETEPNEAERREQGLVNRLLDAGNELLAGLVGWHRREDRPGWWEFFHYRELTDDDLVADATAIGGVGEPVYERDEKRSKVWRYPIPLQETRLAVGDDAFDVDTRGRVGAIVALDLVQGWVELKVGKDSEAARPRALQPGGPVNTSTLRESIATTAETLLAANSNLAIRLVNREVPSALPVRDGEPPGDALTRIGSALDGEVLAVQGPPGTGKSYNAARLIRALLDQGKKVGVTALSHAVIGELLAKVERPALQKATKEQWCGRAHVTRTEDNSAVATALHDGDHSLVGGSAWLWARPEMRDSVDVLIVDEAGQFSLANAVAVAPAARSLVLLGDPQQLTQPSQAEHPHGGGVSALEHLLDGRPTVPADSGIFFDRTHRMHPDVNAFVSSMSYEGRLDTWPDTQQQSIGGTGPWSGTGLRWVPVSHIGNTTSAPEEAQVIADIVAKLLGADWTDQNGRTQPISIDDVLVVAPYNVQAALLRDVVPPGVRVGTVDKFQGREGAVVIYSLTSSSAADAPRGLGFLYDTHRLNVAVSRARALAILVGSPALLDAPVRHPEQLPLVNAYCRYVEIAARE